MKSSQKYHWLNRRSHVSHGRIAWHGEQSDEQYWYNYWKARLDADYYLSAEAKPLASDELGKVLLQSMPPQGLHLEAGCGAGYWVAALKHHGFNIEGIEYTQNLVELVHSVYPQLPIRWGNALNIDTPNDYYDSYLSFGVVEHRIEGPEPFLAEAYRILKPQGKIVISVPFFGPIRRLKSWLSLYDTKQPVLPFFQYGFTQRQFTAHLQQAGFAIEAIHVLYIDRLLIEEIPLYRWLSFRRKSNFFKQCAERLLRNRDGHMLLVVGRKIVKDDLAFP
jgi:SAM-dependent methyltransferase